MVDKQKYLIVLVAICFVYGHGVVLQHVQPAVLRPANSSGKTRTRISLSNSSSHNKTYLKVGSMFVTCTQTWGCTNIPSYFQSQCCKFCMADSFKPLASWVFQKCVLGATSQESTTRSESTTQQESTTTHQESTTTSLDCYKLQTDPKLCGYCATEPPTANGQQMSDKCPFSNAAAPICSKCKGTAAYTQCHAKHFLDLCNGQPCCAADDPCCGLGDGEIPPSLTFLTSDKEQKIEEQSTKFMENLPAALITRDTKQKIHDDSTRKASVSKICPYNEWAAPTCGSFVQAHMYHSFCSSSGGKCLKGETHYIDPGQSIPQVRDFFSFKFQCHEFGVDEITRMKGLYPSLSVRATGQKIPAFKIYGMPSYMDYTVEQMQSMSVDELRSLLENGMSNTRCDGATSTPSFYPVGSHGVEHVPDIDKNEICMTVPAGPGGQSVAVKFLFAGNLRRWYCMYQLTGTCEDFNPASEYVSNSDCVAKYPV